MTKIATLLALACVLLLGASAASILARASVPAAGTAGMAPISSPVANRDSKADKLTYVAAAPASQADAAEVADDTTIASSRPVQLAYAADDSLPTGAVRSATALPPVVTTAPAQKPKVVAKPAPKPALLSDTQIAQIKTRLNLSSSQEYYWASVEQALRAIGRKMNASPRVAANSGPPSIDPDSAEVQQLKYAAMPLLFQLREDQKVEVRKLARAMGLDAVAEQI